MSNTPSNISIDQARNDDDEFVLSTTRYDIVDKSKNGDYYTKSFLYFSIYDWANCCGIREVGKFSYRNLSEDLFTKFKETLDDHADNFDYCFAHLVITQEMDNWREWEEHLMRTFPNTKRSRWRINPNSGNKIRFYILQVGTKQHPDDYS